MATITVVEPSPCDVLGTLRAAAGELAAAIAHMEAYLLDPQPGQVYGAARAAKVAAATLQGAACDTQTLARAASVAAFLDAA